MTYAERLYGHMIRTRVKHYRVPRSPKRFFATYLANVQDRGIPAVCRDRYEVLRNSDERGVVVDWERVFLLDFLIDIRIHPEPEETDGEPDDDS